MELVDTHIHLDFDDFDGDRQEVIDRAGAAGVTRLIAIGATFETAPRAIALAETHSNIWATAGIHPHEAAQPPDFDRLKELAGHPRVVAVGETGFDFHYDFATPADQERWFRGQIEIAKLVKKPLIIHCRKAAEETLRVLRSEKASEIGGVFHCFSEDAEVARELRELNFLISVGGVITFKNASAVREALAEIPLEQIMLETDAPYLAPHPFRGKRCESSHIPLIAAQLAQIKGVPVETVAEVTTATAIRFFGLT